MPVVGKRPARSPDRRIAQLAARQHGIVGAQQLRALGVGAEAVRYRVRTHRLHRVHVGVYAVGHPLVGADGRYLAAVLSCGPRSVLSHGSAADLWELRRSRSRRVHVTLPRGMLRRRPGITVHSTRFLPDRDVTERNGIRTTSPARTLVDLAGVLRPRDLERVVEQAEVIGLFDGVALDEALVRGRGRPGVARLRRLLADLSGEPPPVRSELERRFLSLVGAAGLPAPVVNARIGRHEVDFHWPGAQLIVETDGRATHDTAHAFERDRRRDLALTLAGWHVIRITWRQLTREPERITALLRARVSS